MRKFLMWLVWNVPLGKLAPYVMGLALKSKPISKNILAVKVAKKEGKPFNHPVIAVFFTEEMAQGIFLGDDKPLGLEVLVDIRNWTTELGG